LHQPNPLRKKLFNWGKTIGLRKKKKNGGGRLQAKVLQPKTILSGLRVTLGGTPKGNYANFVVQIANRGEGNPLRGEKKEIGRLPS